MTAPRDLEHGYLGTRAWTLLAKARNCRNAASQATNHYDADAMSWFQDEYVRMARKYNHESIRARRATQSNWVPPSLRSIAT